MWIKKVLALVLIGVLAVPGFSSAAMSSTNYFIYADSVDLGGDLATSTSYNLQDTVGENSVGISSSTSYEVRAGYQALERGDLSFTIGGSSVNFGSLASVGVVVATNIIATVDTDSASGYSLSVSDVSGTALTAVSDGVVDGAGGTEEYGLAVSGTHAAYATDVAIVSGLVLSSVSVPAENDQTTLMFKVVRGNNSTVTSYSQNIILTVSANI